MSPRILSIFSLGQKRKEYTRDSACENTKRTCTILTCHLRECLCAENPGP
jgi:hypothetical protein